MGKLTKAFEKSAGSNGRTTSLREPASPQPQPPGESNKTVAPAAASTGAPIPRESWDRRLQISTDPNSVFFENFRRLRAAILYPESGRRPKTLLVTSTVPGEGKGFVCANLGVALSQGMEQHALMVDCDFRQPTLAALFGLPNEAGLVDYLQDEMDLPRLIRKTGQPKLSVLPSGRPPKNPAELLESARMLTLIRELAERYPDRLVLFDSPPNIVASETGILAKHIDGVIMVVRHGSAKKEHVKQFTDALGPEKIYGVVFNAFPENAVEAFLEKKLGYGYGSGYYHYSSYGYDR